MKDHIRPLFRQVDSGCPGRDGHPARGGVPWLRLGLTGFQEDSRSGRELLSPRPARAATDRTVGAPRQACWDSTSRSAISPTAGRRIGSPTPTGWPSPWTADRPGAFPSSCPPSRASSRPGRSAVIVTHMRTFCHDRNWARGELNMPRALATEKAFPEDEAVVTMRSTPKGTAGSPTSSIYRAAAGRENQLEIIAPFGWQRRASSPATRTGAPAWATWPWG